MAVTKVVYFGKLFGIYIGILIVILFIDNQLFIVILLINNLAFILVFNLESNLEISLRRVSLSALR